MRARLQIVPAVLVLWVAATAPGEPGAGKPEWRETNRVVLRAFTFGDETAYLEPESKGAFELVVERMQERPEVRVRIEVHTADAEGEEDVLALSQARAEAVERIMVGYGIDPARVDTVGLGGSRPIAPNDTEKGRRLNRRVELIVLEPAA